MKQQGRKERGKVDVLKSIVCLRENGGKHAGEKESHIPDEQDGYDK